MNMLVTLYIWLTALLGVPTATGEEGLRDVGDQQTMSQSATSSSSSGKKRGLTRKGYIYNGF